MNYIHKLDNWIIEVVQESYLWIWDRTGIYIGTLIFAACVGDRAFWGSVDWLGFIWLGFMGMQAAWRYLAQSKDLRELNDMQRMYCELTLRFVCALLFFFFLAVSVIEGNFRHIISNVFALMWIYLFCVQVRERDPKELFTTFGMQSPQPMT